MNKILMDQLVIESSNLAKRNFLSALNVNRLQYMQKKKMKVEIK